MSSTPPPAATDAALRSVYTSNLPALFGQLQVSVVISTYQAGEVLLIRNDEGVLNTHFRTFGKPMGIAGDRARLTIGGTNTVWYYRNLPAVAGKLEPPGKYDACYLPGRVHVTGDIEIHELCWDAKDELWLVNTRFGCLCTVPQVPDWRWGLTDPTTPWYPSMRLFRQDRRGDWAGVMGRVSEALLGGRW